MKTHSTHIFDSFFPFFISPVSIPSSFNRFFFSSGRAGNYISNKQSRKCCRSNFPVSILFYPHLVSNKTHRSHALIHILPILDSYTPSSPLFMHSIKVIFQGTMYSSTFLLPFLQRVTKDLAPRLNCADPLLKHWSCFYIYKHSCIPQQLSQ